MLEPSRERVGTTDETAPDPSFDPKRGVVSCPPAGADRRRADRRRLHHGWTGGLHGRSGGLGGGEPFGRAECRTFGCPEPFGCSERLACSHPVAPCAADARPVGGRPV